MNRLFLYCISLCFLISCAKNDDEVKTFDEFSLLENVGKNIIYSHYQNFETNTNLLIKEIKIDNLEKLQNTWKSCQNEWQMCQLYEIGEIKKQFLHFPLYKHPIDTQQIEEFIINNETFDLTNVSSSIKGLACLEYLLFYKTDLLKDKHLNYLEAVAKDVNSQAKNLVSVWNNSSDFYTNNQRNTDGSINQLVNQMISLLEEISNSKLSKPLYENAKVEAPFSQYSIQLIEYNLLALQELYLGKEGISFDDYLIFSEKDNLNNQIKAQLKKCISLSKFNTSLQDKITNDKEKVIELHTEIKKLLVLIKVDLSSQLSIIVTFNDADGD